MIDGFDIEYYRNSDMPILQQLAAQRLVSG